ncbi:hypothetical protein GGH98_002371, partial [Coemansia sp. RSA 454]
MSIHRVVLPNNLPRSNPMRLREYVRALESISDPEEHANAVFNGSFEWNKVTPLKLPRKFVSESQYNNYYVGVDADSVIITTNDLSFLRGSVKLQFAHSYDGAITNNTH